MRILTRSSPFLFLLLAFAFLPGCQTDARDSAQTTAIGLDADLPGIQDRIFVQDALAAGKKEIKMALLGLERADNLELRLLAQRIFDDHSKANRDLSRIAEQEQIPSLPTTTAPADHTDHLMNLTGPEFDRKYLQHMLEAHREDIKKFETAARNARSRSIRDFAAQTLPVLREHHRIAGNIQRTAQLGVEINEAAGAEAPRRDASPYYQGDAQRRHQFDR